MIILTCARERPTYFGASAQKIVRPHIVIGAQLESLAEQSATSTLSSSQAGIAWHRTFGFVQKIVFPHIVTGEQSASLGSHAPTWTSSP